MQRDTGAGLVGLILGLVALAVMAVIVVKVIDRQDADVKRALDSAPIQLSDTGSAPGGAGRAGLPGAATPVACTTEKQTLDGAEEVAKQVEGRAFTSAELVSAHYLKGPPTYYEVVVQADGTPLVRTLDPRVCP